MSGKLTSEGIARAAAAIGCEVNAIRAVIAVETNGDGFLLDGRPKILFERHVFHRLTQGKWDVTAPDVSSATPGGYGNGTAEWSRMYAALQLDAEAAVQSASYGLGQIMGFNWKLCGEKSLLGFLLAMHHNEDAQLALMAQFIVSQGMAGHLIRHEWTSFARKYNGSAFARNQYDTKLANAFSRASREAP